MSEAIRAIIFDVGGVLIRTFDHAGRLSWETRLGLPPGGAEAAVLNSEMGRRAQTGEITDAALWQWVRDHLRLGDEWERFRRDFWRGDAVDPSLVAIIRSLRPRYQTAIISNASDALFDTLERYGLREEFDLVVGSAYEGVMKPDPRIYRHTLQRLSCAAEEAVFIDDSLPNITAAEALGMKAIYYIPGLDLSRELALLGVPPDPIV